MSRIWQGVLAIGFVVGVGFATQYFYREWVTGVIKDAETASRKETAKWKAVQTNFDGVKFDKPIMTMPKVDIGRPGQSRPKDNSFR
jgi:hypothetical protein